MPTSITIVGGGLVGLGTALEVKRLAPQADVRLLEKEPAVGQHQSGHNSGVMHAGLYYKPGSLKARFSTAGRAELARFADEHGIPYRVTGKLVVAASAAEAGRFDALLERGRANGLAVREVDPAE